MKNFDIWNKEKKDIDNTKMHVWSRERDIWWCSLGENVGYEQDGKGEKYLRPVIVIKNFGVYTALIVPLTTSLKENRFHFKLGSILGKDASGIITQIRLIDTKRLVEKEGKLSEEVFIKLKKSIQDLLA
ncbi:MAG: type II toxin-antitoxin system PemK/MazF family toxin [Patescibacteria group bacterium]